MLLADPNSGCWLQVLTLLIVLPLLRPCSVVFESGRQKKCLLQTVEMQTSWKFPLFWSDRRLQKIQSPLNGLKVNKTFVQGIGNPWKVESTAISWKSGRSEILHVIQCVYLRENLQETSQIFPWNMGVSCNFSLKPTHWDIFQLSSSNCRAFQLHTAVGAPAIIQWCGRRDGGFLCDAFNNNHDELLTKHHDHGRLFMTKHHGRLFMVSREGSPK